MEIFYDFDHVRFGLTLFPLIGFRRPRLKFQGLKEEIFEGCLEFDQSEKALQRGGYYGFVQFHMTEPGMHQDFADWEANVRFLAK